jgi:predicted ribosome quality control (RQC) complex YloA/Tae2 family protein
VEVPDTRGGPPLQVTVDPRLSGPANADRLFARARRIDNARATLEVRLGLADAALDEALRREATAARARRLADLRTSDPRPVPPRRDEAPSAGPRHYLTSRGVSVLVGRGARENHELTFGLAAPEDLWLHARDVPGAHVILRDRDHRARADDIREAAELAAFFSDASGQAAVDVHVTRRKHVRPGRGSAGRVLIGHSDTVRAAPRDPEGRLRRR